MPRAISTPVPKPLAWFFFILLGWMMVLSWLRLPVITKKKGDAMAAYRIAIFAAVSVVITLGRLTVPWHGPSWPGTFEALAHLWCGVLIGIIVISIAMKIRWWRLPLILLVAITTFEGIAFVHRWGT